MRTLAIIENGIVTNIIVIPEGEAGNTEIKARKGVEVTGLNIGMGWKYDGKNFIEPEPTPEFIEAKAKAAEQQALKDSANAKLLALGLSPQEIAAITGN